MMRVFGGFRADAFAAYMEEFPLADGWQDPRRPPPDRTARRPRDQVPGGGYAGAAARAIGQYAG